MSIGNSKALRQCVGFSAIFVDALNQAVHGPRRYRTNSRRTYWTEGRRPSSTNRLKRNALAWPDTSIGR